MNEADFATESWQASLLNATGISWPDWIAFFEASGNLGHAQWAKLAYAKMQEPAVKPNPEMNLHWWAQGVTIAFEHYKGLRVSGERCDGTFAGGVSKTINGDLDSVFTAWKQWVCGNLPEYNGAFIEEEPRISETPKWRYWRANFSDGSKVSINLTLRQAGKTVISADHTGLSDQAAVNSVKEFWRPLLAEFAVEYKKSE